MSRACVLKKNVVTDLWLTQMSTNHRRETGNATDWSKLKSMVLEIKWTGCPIFSVRKTCRTKFFSSIFSSVRVNSRIWARRLVAPCDKSLFVRHVGRVPINVVTSRRGWTRQTDGRTFPLIHLRRLLRSAADKNLSVKKIIPGLGSRFLAGSLQETKFLFFLPKAP